MQDKTQKKLKAILAWVDDIAYAIGVASLAVSGFIIHAAAGFAVIGIGLVAFAILCGRGSK